MLPRVYFLRTFCLCSLRYDLNLISYVFPQSIQSQGFLILFYVLSGPGAGSPGGTTPSILPPPPPPVVSSAQRSHFHLLRNTHSKEHSGVSTRLLSLIG